MPHLMYHLLLNTMLLQYTIFPITCGGLCEIGPMCCGDIRRSWVEWIGASGKLGKMLGRMLEAAELGGSLRAAQVTPPTRPDKAAVAEESGELKGPSAGPTHAFLICPPCPPPSPHSSPVLASLSTMPSPPKPWERGGVAAPSTSPLPAAISTATPASSTAASTAAPSVPTRPASFTGPTTSTLPLTTNSSLSNTAMSPYSSSYSPYRYGSSYSSYSPYGMNSMYGGMGYSGYGGYGGYGMNGMYGGMPGMGYGMPGPGGPFDPNNPSLTQTLESTTQHTFALLHSIVQTFSGVAQMLESTFMATHSSFFAMVGVVDQFGQLRNALGSVLGLFGLVRWLRDLLVGRGNPSTGAMRGEFRDFINGRPVQGPLQQNQVAAPKASKKPLIIFLLAIFGVPYAMHKLVRIISERQREQMAAQGGQLPGGPLPPLEPSQLVFARALYSFEASSPAELALKENEIVAIMGKLDPATGAEVDPRIEVRSFKQDIWAQPLTTAILPLQVEGSEWWKGRTREGREGWFPKKWVQVLERRKPVDPTPDVKKVE